MESNNNIKIHQIDKACMTEEQFIKYIIEHNYNDNMFDFENFPFKLSEKTVDYICPKCKNKFEAPIEAVLEFE